MLKYYTMFIIRKHKAGWRSELFISKVLGHTEEAIK